MPQAPRRDTQAVKLQDKEAKRARGVLSCAECRRLKLKCDKTVPCSSCRRRGCSAICPNGSLITGQGTRFVLADTEKLHHKITQMSDRIRQLEDALAIAQSALTGPNGEPHPLLSRELTKIKSSIELHSASTATGGGGSGSTVEDIIQEEFDDEADEEKYIDAFGTLAIRDGGAATFYGRSAGQESLLIGEVGPASPSDGGRSPPCPYGISATSSYSDVDSEAGLSSQLYQQQQHQSYDLTAADAPLSDRLAALAQAFPLTPSISSFASNPHEPITFSTLVTHYLPSYDEASRLVQLYLEQAPWFFGAVTQKELEQEIMPMWYEEEISLEHDINASNRLPGAAAVGKRHRTGTSHDLALLFMVFCFGSLTDMNLPPPPDNSMSDKFHQLAKVALTLDPNAPAEVKSTKNGILDRPPSVATVQTFSLMAIYEGLCSGENSIESTWVLFGLATKLSQSIGLHRDSARWKLPPAEVQKRRALFWELFITDCWQGLATGRLATFSLPFVDCELPYDPDQTMAEDGSIQPSFPFWKARFGAECVSAVVQGTLTSRAPKYSIILDLDRKVRDMELPLYAHGEPPQGKSLRQTMSHFMPQNYRELTLLYIHRCFFAHAIASNPLDPIKSQYAPSFLAGYRSACTIVNVVKQQFLMFPAQIARFWVLWTHAFSASIMLASVATHASRSSIAPAALMELKTACDLFEAASKYGGRAGKFLPILRRLQTKAQKVYREGNSGMPPSIPNDIFKPSSSGEEKDELSIFGGKTHTVSTVSTPAQSARSNASSSPISQTTGSPPTYTDNPFFAGVHPSLISELNLFQPLIRQQVQNAYRIGGELFGGGPMMIDPIRCLPAGQITAPLSRQSSGSSPPGFEHNLPNQYHHQQTMARQAELDRERLERERQELERHESERLEMERHELERQEVLFQQQLEFERQQTAQQEMQGQQEIRLRELERHQQQAQDEAIRRQEEKTDQLQRQEQYRLQLAMQQHQIQQQQQMAQYQQPRQSVDVAMYAGQQHPGVQQPLPASKVMAPPPPPVQNSAPHLQRQISNSQSSSNLRQRYQEHQYQKPPPSTHDLTPQRSSSSSSGMPVQMITPQHTGRRSQQNFQQQPSFVHCNGQVSTQHTPGGMPPVQRHSMHTLPSSEYAQQRAPPPLNPPVGYTSSDGSYGQSSTAFAPETYKYWPAASTSFAMPAEHPPPSQAAVLPPGYHSHSTLHQQQLRPQHYNPDDALRGIAADDRSLQETWQSYMNKVGSPRQFLED